MSTETPSRPLELSIVVPAYNESGAIEGYPDELLAPLDALGRSYEVIVVDDGSKDGTAERAGAIGDPVRVVPHPRNLGLSAAVQTGLREARAPLVVTLDADLTFSPTLISALLERFDQGDVDVVSGSPKLAGYDPSIARWRVWISKGAGKVYAWVLGQDITSVSPILRLYRTEHVQELLPVRAEGFEINAELLFELVRRGRRISEIPAPLGKRQEGTSSLNYRREVPRHLRLLGRMVCWRVGL